MNYISTKEAAQKWDIGVRRVQHFCANGKVPGARHIGRQWLIPVDAKRPVDRRTRLGKMDETEEYRFPVFIYSSCYAHPNDLDENEQQLLRAQIMRLEGKFAKSIGVCRNILSGDVPPYLAAGVHLTLGFDFLLMGIASEYRRALSSIDQLIADGIQHAEDIKLMRAFLYSHGSFDCTPVFAIRPEKLSAEAAIYYKYCLISTSIVSGHTNGLTGLRYCQSDIMQLERDGITPALFSFHYVLGSSANMDVSLEEREQHMRAAVDLAVENGWTAVLSKFYNSAPGLIDKCLASHGDSCVKNFKKVFQATMKNWKVVHASETGCTEFQHFSTEQIELLLLVSYGYSNKTMATVKGMTKAEVDRAVVELCAVVGADTKAELVKYAEGLFVPEVAAR